MSRKLDHLNDAVTKAQQAYVPRSRGAPKRNVLDEAVARLRPLLIAKNLDVELYESGSLLEQRRSLGGQGGALLIKIFELDRQISESDIWGAWQRTEPVLPDEQPADPAGL